MKNAPLKLVTLAQFSSRQQNLPQPQAALIMVPAGRRFVIRPTRPRLHIRFNLHVRSPFSSIGAKRAAGIGHAHGIFFPGQKVRRLRVDRPARPGKLAGPESLSGRECLSRKDSTPLFAITHPPPPGTRHPLPLDPCGSARACFTRKLQLQPRPANSVNLRNRNPVLPTCDHSAFALTLNPDLAPTITAKLRGT